MRDRGISPGQAIAAAGVLAVFVLYLALTLAAASYTLGCDYLAYDGAARAWLAGRTPYDTAVTAAGSCGTYQYPPPFLLLIVPLTVLPPAAATWVFIIASAVCLPLAVLAMPVPAPARIVTLALAGTSWPVLFAVKVGALGPFLFLLFALAWRWLDRPARLAAVTALGTFAKVLPGLLGLWMLLTGRYRAASITVGIGVVVALPWLLLQPAVWWDYLAVERTITATVTSVPANFSPASLLFFAGIPMAAAQALGALHTIAVLALVVLIARRGSPDASLVVTAVASQVAAPVLWDHYTVVLFLAVAWLVSRRQLWVVIPAVAMNATFIAWLPPLTWVGSLDLAMVGVAAVDLLQRRRALASAPAAPTGALG